MNYLLMARHLKRVYNSNYVMPLVIIINYEVKNDKRLYNVKVWRVEIDFKVRVMIGLDAIHAHLISFRWSP